MILRLFVSWILVGIDGAVGVAGVDVKSVMGIHPDKVTKYEPIIDGETGEKTWRCLGDSSIELSYDQINDNYCDCPDGSDEPGTNACPYSGGRMFYCRNQGYFPGYIENFKLNDGVCDYDLCCDGSDEWQTGQCEDRCGAIFEQYSAFKQEVEERTRVALDIKKTLLGKAQEEKNKLVTTAEALEDGLKQKQRELELVKRLVKQGGENDKNQGSSIFDEFSPLFKKLSGGIESEKQRSSVVAKRIEFLEGILSGLMQNYNPNFNDWAVKDSVRKYQDYVSNKEGEEGPGNSDIHTVLQELVAKSQKMSYNPVHQSQELSGSNLKPTFSNMVHYYFSSFVDTFFSDSDTTMDKNEAYSPMDEIAYDRDSDKVKELRKVIKSLETEISIIREDLAKNYGKDDLLRALSATWVNQDLGGYRYKLGFLDSIHQDNVLIGKFHSFDGDSLFYMGGSKCWNGPYRSAVVKLECGAENEILSVGEPEKCEYHFAVTSPIACEEMTESDIRKIFKIDYSKL